MNEIEWAEQRLREIGATGQRLREIERARAEQLDIARSWILLFTLAATFGLWWVFHNQLKLGFYVSWLLGFAVAFVLSRKLSSYVGMHFRKKYDAQLKDQLLGRDAEAAQKGSS